MAVIGINLGITNSLVSYFGENGATIGEEVPEADKDFKLITRR